MRKHGRPHPRSAHAQIDHPGRRHRRRRSPPARWRSPSPPAPATERRRSIQARSVGGQHGRLRLHGARRTGPADGRRQLDPATRSRRAARTSAGSTRARYYVNDRQHRRRPRGHRATAGSSSTRFRNPDSFLYALPGVDSIDDPNLNIVQTLRPRTGETLRGSGRKRSAKRIARDVPVAPTNVGPKTFPDYDAVADAGDPALPGGGKSFVGPASTIRSSSTWARSFDGINLGKPGGRHGRQPGRRQGRLSGYNTHSFVLQMPERRA